MSCTIICRKQGSQADRIQHNVELYLTEWDQDLRFRTMLTLACQCLLMRHNRLSQMYIHGQIEDIEEKRLVAVMQNNLYVHQFALSLESWYHWHLCEVYVFQFYRVLSFLTIIASWVRNSRNGLKSKHCWYRLWNDRYKKDSKAWEMS